MSEEERGPDLELLAANRELDAMEERLEMLERYIREGDDALVCEFTSGYGPGCGGCDNCTLAQVIHGIRSKP